MGKQEQTKTPQEYINTVKVLSILDEFARDIALDAKVLKLLTPDHKELLVSKENSGEHGILEMPH